MRYVTAVSLTVRDASACADFLCEALGYQREQQDDGQGIWLNNGCTPLRLSEGEGAACLQVCCSDVGRDAAVLMQHPAITSHDDITQSGALVVQRLHSRFGLDLQCYRILNEDEMDVLPPLPANLPWDEQCDLQVRRILRIVPVDFRQKARQRVTERAEYLTLAAGDITVSQAHAVQALRDVTLDFQQQALTDALRAEGIDDA